MMETMISYYTNSPEKCILLTNYILKNKTDNYTLNEAVALTIGSTIITKIDKKKASEIASIAVKTIEDSLQIIGNQFYAFNINQKKQYLQEITNYYLPVILLYGIILDYDESFSSKFDDLPTYFHELVFKNRSLFDATNPNEAITLAKILKLDYWYYHTRRNYEFLLNDLYPELQKLHSCDYPDIDHEIYNTMQFLKNDIVEFGFTDKGKGYLADRANFLLQYMEYSLYNRGNIRASSYDNISWVDIQSSLQPDECAVLMYDYSISSTRMLSGIVITPSSSNPQDVSMLFDNTSPEAFIDLLERSYPNCNRFYICPIDSWENVDVAYNNEKIYIKHSLADLTRNTKSLHYTGGIITVFADINYGRHLDEDSVPPLNDGKLILSKIKELYGSKFYCLSGDQVKKINFYNILNEVSILHVSTHGKAKSNHNDVVPNNTIDLYNSIVGLNEMAGYGLALSNYNENNLNYISAKDIIQHLELPGNQLIFLDACVTGKSKSLLYGPNSLAKAFYTAGAANVISYLTDVKEKVATDFCIMFYEELHASPDSSYHDIFYRTKQRIINKYRDTIYLANDKYGRPDIGIVLWE